MQAETATLEERPTAPAENRTGQLRAFLGRWEALLIGLILVTFVVGQSLSSEFLTADSFTTGSLDLSEVALMALALTLVIVAAEIDLSVASVLALSSALMAELWNAGPAARADHADLHRRRRAVRRLQRHPRDAASGCPRWRSRSARSRCSAGSPSSSSATSR